MAEVRAGSGISRITIHQGDVFDRLAAMPDESSDCVVTSPPYWGLRSYLPDNSPDKAREIGLEPSLSEHLDVMIRLFREVRRVLKSDGTCWVNYGDSYASTPNGRSAADGKATGNDDRTFRDKPFSTIQGNMKAKDLCMLPNRLAIALQDDGWWVRSEIVWHKPNPMPESVRDRPACAHEKIFLITKSRRYWYDAAAVRTESKWDPSKSKMPDGWDTGPGAHGAYHRQGRQKGKKTDKQRGHGRHHAGFNERWDALPKSLQQSGGAHLKNVWTVATKPFSEAHYATYPPDLIRPCIRAGCRPGGIVLDPFGGAGTTALVAAQEGRDAILIEIDPNSIDIARRRLTKEIGMLCRIESAAEVPNGR